jgi:hypothetical protein
MNALNNLKKALAIRKTKQSPNDPIIMSRRDAEALIMALSNIRVAITTEGGLVSFVGANIPGIKYQNVDYDAEGCDEVERAPDGTECTTSGLCEVKHLRTKGIGKDVAAYNKFLLGIK